MINPSASGWIGKYFSGPKRGGTTDAQEFYRQVRDTGFIYGHVVTAENLTKAETNGWTAEEMTKAALLITLYNTYRLITKEEDTKEFINKAVLFYKEMTPEGFSLLKKVLPASPRSHELETIIDARVKTNDNLISRNFSHIITNALLFMDVLAFRQYLLKSEIPGKYLKRLERTVVGIVTLALKSKSRKGNYDDLLIKLFESSVRYTRFSINRNLNIDKLGTGYFKSDIEKVYLLDMAGMAIWDDGHAEQNEIEFLYRLAARLDIDDNTVADSIATFDIFIRRNRKNIPYFNYSHPVKHFYDHTANTVALLIKRNKNRLIKELSNNGELMLLLTHSTHRNLDKNEKKKVKKQLLEICKTIPSLTIFLLPGGSLLLPLLIKFIPQLLPSVFNENLEKE